MSTGLTIQTMAADEARACADNIRHGVANIGQRLLGFRDREGWRALGYSTFREWGQMEFGFSQSYVYRLLRQAEVEQNFSPIGEKLHIPERQARPPRNAHTRPAARSLDTVYVEADT